jgi:hypothetical protein
MDEVKMEEKKRKNKKISEGKNKKENEIENKIRK